MAQASDTLGQQPPKDARSDAELVAAWRNGDLGAANQLLARHFRMVFRFFSRRLHDGAEDLTQRTFLVCIEKASELRQDDSFPAFVLTIARHLLLRHLEKAERRGRIASSIAAPPPRTETSPSAAVAMREEHRLLRRALDTLPLDAQLLIELHYWDRLTMEEIGRVFETKSGTVKWRLAKARKLLRERIREASTNRNLVDSTLIELDRLTGPLPSPDPSA